MKKYAIKGLSLFILAFAIFSTLTITWDRSTNTFLIQPGQRTAFALQLADCICCHGSTVDRHHRLAASDAFPCVRCHEVIFDPVTQLYTPQLIRDCTVCHTIDVALLDRHHVLANQVSCFTCHQLVLDPVTQSYYVTLLEQCSTVAPDAPGQTAPVSHYSEHAVALNDCTSCHLCNLFDQHGERCELCHTSANSAVQTAIQTKNTQCTACHPPALQHSRQCGICHTDKVYDPSQRAATHKTHMTHVACGVCHEIPETTTLEPTGQYCILCHGTARSYNLSSLPGIHRDHVQQRVNSSNDSYRYEYVPYSCYQCHGQAVPQTQPKQCIPCHDDKTYKRSDLSSIHSLHNRRFDCSNCHYNPRLFGVDPTSPCLRCHEARSYTSGYQLHAQHSGRQCWSCHASENVSAKAGKTCASCHGAPVTYTSTTDLHYRHDTKAYQCWVCHQQLTPMYITTCDPLNGPCNGTIAGKVTTTSGAALGGATVFTNPGGFLAVTASDGTYSLMADSDITYTVTALKTGYDQISTTVTVLSNKTIAQNFMLPASPKGTISGKVTTSGGSGLSNVTVSTDLGGYRATTSWSGAYSLSVTPGTYIVTASKSGYANNTTVVTVSPGQTVTTNLILTTTTARGTITGKVTDDSGLVALSGAVLSTNIGGYTATAAADGTYSLSVNPGTYIVTARKTGYATNSKAVTVYSYKTATVNIAMIVLPPGTISGTVIDSGGVAISGATVATNTGGYVTTTAMNGTYSLTDVDAGTYTVTASKGGYTSNSATVTVSSALTVTANITLTVVTTTGKISGKVTTSGGAALAGATVATNTGGYATTSASDGTYSLTVLTGTYTVTASKSGYNNNSTTAAVAANQTVTINFALTALPGTISGKVSDQGGVAISGATISTNTGGYTTTTAVDGTYSLTNVSVGTYTVTASKSGYNSSSATTPVSAGAMISQNFTLTALPGKISGKVTNPGGVALSGATVATNIGGYTATTATDGTYSLTSVNVGTYAVTASKSGYNSSIVTITVAAGATVAQNFTLAVIPGTISGRVTDAAGVAISGAAVSTNTGGYTATAAVDGSYSLTVAPGTYTVTASNTGFVSNSATVAVAAGAAVTQNFTLALPGIIGGKVTDSGGVAISGATISTNTGGYTTTTAADGTYSLTNVIAGTYTVTASKSGYTSNSTSATVVAGQAVTSNITLTAVPSKGTISGTVKDSHGSSLSGVTVSTNSGGYTTTTSSNGTYTLTVNPGSYTVTASKSGYSSASKTVTVQSNQTTTASFTLNQSYSH